MGSAWETPLRAVSASPAASAADGATRRDLPHVERLADRAPQSKAAARPRPRRTSSARRSRSVRRAAERRPGRVVTGGRVLAAPRATAEHRQIAAHHRQPTATPEQRQTEPLVERWEHQEPRAAIAPSSGASPTASEWSQPALGRSTRSRIDSVFRPAAADDQRRPVAMIAARWPSRSSRFRGRASRRRARSAWDSTGPAAGPASRPDPARDGSRSPPMPSPVRPPPASPPRVGRVITAAARARLASRLCSSLLRGDRRDHAMSRRGRAPSRPKRRSIAAASPAPESSARTRRRSAGRSAGAQRRSTRTSTLGKRTSGGTTIATVRSDGPAGRSTAGGGSRVEEHGRAVEVEAG